MPSPTLDVGARKPRDHGHVETKPIADRTLRRHQRGDAFRLTAAEGLAALSLDALSSVAYGPEAIVLVLVSAGAAAVTWTLPVSLAITAGAASLGSVFPALSHHLLAVTLAGLVVLTVMNLIGVAESAKVLMAPTVVFIFAIVAPVAAGLARSHPVAVIGADPGPAGRSTSPTCRSPWFSRWPPTPASVACRCC